MTDLVGLRFFRRGSDFCLLDSDFGGWSDRLFRFRKRDCFCFTGFDKEKRRSYQPPKSSSGKQKSEPPRKKRKPTKSVSEAQSSPAPQKVIKRSQLKKMKQEVTKSSSTNPDVRSWESVPTHPEGIDAETKAWKSSESHHQHPICSSATVSKDSRKSDP